MLSIYQRVQCQDMTCKWFYVCEWFLVKCMRHWFWKLIVFKVRFGFSMVFHSIHSPKSMCGRGTTVSHHFPILYLNSIHSKLCSGASSYRTWATAWSGAVGLSGVCPPSWIATERWRTSWWRMSCFLLGVRSGGPLKAIYRQYQSRDVAKSGDT